MVSRQTQDSMALTGILAATVGLVAFVALMLAGDWRFAPAFFIALFIAVAVAVVLFVAFHPKERGPAVPPSSGTVGTGTGTGAAAAASGAGASVAATASSAAEKVADAGASAAESAKAAAAEVTEEVQEKLNAGEDVDLTDYDKDGVSEGENEGTRPEGLDAPRGGKADNLKEIKGIGPKLEQLCHELGFYHFDQIANWGPDEVAWVDANLEGFKGRVTRDDWVAQAKVLAAGGETEFSKRVEDGDVY